MKARYLRYLKLSLFLTTITTLRLLGDTALPRLEVVNSTWAAVTNLWQGTEPLQFPRQLIIDFSREKSGVILGLVCEYPKSDSLFESIRQRLQEDLKIKPRIETAGQFVLWRDEAGKRTVSLALDQPKENIQLIVVSIDKAVRGSSHSSEQPPTQP